MTNEEAMFPGLVPEPVPSRENADGGGSDLMPRILRGVGAALLVIAASSFMFREWGNADDLVRYLMLLGQLGLLAGAGFVCGLVLDEKRGARTFLSIVVGIIPVHFAVLGGILYSQLAIDAPVSHLAAHAIWQATDATTAILLVLGAQLLILPATFVAMMALARRHARALTLTFIGSCALLLLPAREPNTIAIAVAVVTPILLFLQLRVFSGTATLKTPLGRFVRAMLAVPLLFIVGRTFLYYDVTASFVGVVIFALGLSSFVFDVHQDGEQDEKKEWYFAVTQLAAIGTMVLGWELFAIDIIWERAILGSGPGPFDIPLMVLPAALIVCAASERVAFGNTGYRQLVGLGVMLTIGLNTIVFHELSTAILALGAGLALLAYGTRVEQKAVVVFGSITTLVGLVSLAALMVRIETLTHWATLTALGVGFIFFAAALDRNRQRLLRRLSVLRHRVRDWSY